jgi:hypothetical protein
MEMGSATMMAAEQSVINPSQVPSLAIRRNSFGRQYYGHRPILRTVAYMPDLIR